MRHLEEQLATAHAQADPIRYALLYGTGRPLEDAVQDVLAVAGVTVTRLDDELGTESADLLAEFQCHRVLVEVKSARATPREDLVGKLYKHLETWPALRPGTPVDGGALVVNHQFKREPKDRDPAIYQRRPFVESLRVPVTSSLDLFGWWRAQDWTAIQNAILHRTP